MFLSIYLNLLSISSLDVSCSTTCWMYELTKFLFKAALLSSLRVQRSVIWLDIASVPTVESCEGLNLFLLFMRASMSTSISSTLPTLRYRLVNIFYASSSSCSAPSSWRESKSISWSAVNLRASPPCIWLLSALSSRFRENAQSLVYLVNACSFVLVWFRTWTASLFVIMD